MNWTTRRSTWAGLALVVTLLAAFVPSLPTERALARLMNGMPPAGLWEFLNTIVKTQWLFGTLVLVSGLIVYFLFPTREAAVPLAGLMGGFIMDWILTPLVNRPRPLLGGTGGSFPSGGAIYWAAWLGALAVVVRRRVRSSVVRTTITSVLVAVIALGGIARLAVGAHWLTDVLGAWCWAAAWVLWLHSATRQVS